MSSKRVSTRAQVRALYVCWVGGIGHIGFSTAVLRGVILPAYPCPLSPVLCHLIPGPSQTGNLDVCQYQISSSPLSAMSGTRSHELSKQELFGHPAVIHSCYIPYPPEPMSPENLGRAFCHPNGLSQLP